MISQALRRFYHGQLSEYLHVTHAQADPAIETICLSDIRCKKRLGGLLKSYSRRATYSPSIDAIRTLIVHKRFYTSQKLLTGNQVEQLIARPVEFVVYVGKKPIEISVAFQIVLAGVAKHCAIKSGGF